MSVTALHTIERSLSKLIHRSKINTTHDFFFLSLFFRYSCECILFMLLSLFVFIIQNRFFISDIRDDFLHTILKHFEGNQKLTHTQQSFRFSLLLIIVAGVFWM